ncbi:MAG: ABC transporter ATP-binding protein [SAR202 cluster bacterium]|nr:ABC transporter ATP-binding protein [Chloroflexota bacterium]MQG51267.1 ABC transporter ATP-binding protein [SAR202 cluster bacterium]|tara:strand:- start:7548 stop:8258 length:711 start_codon:yes stop_codon:yes gene_type:complete
MTLLNVKNINAGYGETEILHSVSIQVNEGNLVAIIGPNGSGKSTLLKVIVGLLEAKKGDIEFMTDNITNSSPQKIVELGISYVPQAENVFTNMTIKENLEIPSLVLKFDFKKRLEEILELFPILDTKMNTKAGTLSGGQRQTLAFAKALISKPSLMILDEPSAGLSPIMADATFETIESINKSGVTILIVEQNAKKILSIADRGYVLATGENKIDDTGLNLLNNPDVGMLYLGGSN